MKYFVQFWEQKINKIYLELEADSKEEVEQIALYPGTDGVRPWTEKEYENKIERLIETVDCGIVNIEENATIKKETSENEKTEYKTLKLLDVVNDLNILKNKLYKLNDEIKNLLTEL